MYAGFKKKNSTKYRKIFFKNDFSFPKNIFRKLCQGQTNTPKKAYEDLIHQQACLLPKKKKLA